MQQGDAQTQRGDVPHGGLADPLIDQIPAAIAVFDADLRCVMVNARWLARFPFSGGSPIGRACEEVADPGCERLREYLERGLAGESFSGDPVSIVGDGASPGWFRSHVAPWRSAKGKVLGAMLVCEDISPEMEQTRRCKVLSEELALFIDNARGTALCMLDDTGRVSLWNDGAEQLFGWSEAEVLGKHYDFLFEPDDQAKGLPEVELESARQRGTFRDRGWRMRKDASIFRAEITLSRIEGDNLLPSGFGLVLRDLTRDEHRAQFLEANAVLLGSILESIPDGLVVIDTEGRILIFSKAAEEMFGYTAQEVVGRNVSVLMPEREAGLHDGWMSRYRETGEMRVMGHSRRLTGRRKDGTMFPHSLRLAEAFGGGKRMIAGFVHDLSAEEATQSQLEELQRELAHISRVYEMGTLASTIAHELNQPLMAVSNIVQTAADMLGKGEPASRAALAEALANAGRETLRAGEILRRLRVFLSRGDLEKTLEDPCKLAADAAYFEAAGARYRNIACEIDCPSGMPQILVDRVQIQQVILNLVKNAIQSVGGNGKVAVVIRMEPQHVRFSVIDSGPGVPPERVARLFEPFSTTKTDGMGLGLPICRSIIEAHGGRIWYEAPAEGGACFAFTLPHIVEEIEDDA